MDSEALSTLTSSRSKPDTEISTDIMLIRRGISPELDGSADIRWGPLYHHNGTIAIPVDAKNRMSGNFNVTVSFENTENFIPDHLVIEICSFIKSLILTFTRIEIKLDINLDVRLIYSGIPEARDLYAYIGAVCAIESLMSSGYPMEIVPKAFLLSSPQGNSCKWAKIKSWEMAKNASSLIMVVADATNIYAIKTIRGKVCITSKDILYIKTLFA